MELTLERIELTNVQTTSRKTTRLLPPGKKRRQNVVVADETGMVMCFGMKKDQIEQVFKTAPLGKEASRVELGGTGEERDNIFMASSGTVRAYTKKGKEFLRFNTNLTEPIRSMWVGEEDIHTGGEFMYNTFINCKDTYFFMSSDRINDIVCDRLSGGRSIDAALACQDRMIRVVQGNELHYEAAMGGPVLTIDRYSNAIRDANKPDAFGGFGRQAQDGPSFATNDGRYRELVYGTENGVVGQLLLDKDEMRRGWIIDPVLEGRRGKAGGVQCIASHDITRDGVKDLMIGRDNGGIEVWSFDTGPQPTLVFDKSLMESITSLEVGQVTNIHFDELIVTTYSGKLVSFSSNPSGAAGDEEGDATKDVHLGADAKPGKPVPTVKATKAKKERGDKKIRDLREELETLRAQVEKEREKYAKVSEGLVATEAAFKMNDRWALNADEARYELHIELSMPIDTILIQCDVPIELLGEDSNAIVSRTPPPPGSSAVLVTYRCQEPTNRLQLAMRTTEGRYGALQAYVWPRISPKSCRAKTFQIQPLSLHSRLQTRPPAIAPEGEKALPKMNTLRITGAFSLAEMHSWVVATLPEVPQRLQEEGASFTFRNTFLDTLLLADYRKGEATFQSDSLTTLAIVKEVVTKEATARKVQIQINLDVDPETVTTFLRKIDPMLCYQLALAKKVKLIETLKEVKMQEQDTSFLAKEYLEILENEDAIKRQLREQPGRLQFLYSIVTDLYVDHHKFKGQNVTAQVPQLQRVLQDYSIEAVLGFFARG